MTMYRRAYLLALLATGLLVGAIGPSARAQNYTPSYAPAPPVMADQTSQPAYSADQLDQMLGPIALYPDPLLSEVLAAATYPTDVAAAGQFLQNNPSPSDADISAQQWDDSVKAIAHYPDVVQMMAGSMDWTEALGTAFANQPQDVMDSVQRLRAKAQAAGTLASTPQQDVVADAGAIQILPAQPDVIYVPQYDPGVVYATPGYPGPWITFDTGWPVGLWFTLGWDWHRHFIDRDVVWGHDWHHPDIGHAQPWTHDGRRPIPAPRHSVVVPSRSAARPGTVAPGRPLTAFNPNARTRTAARAAAATPRRPVTGLPATPRPAAAAPRTDTPMPRTAAPAPRAATPLPTPRVPAAPRALPTPSIPHAIAPPAPARPIGRPVTGMPARPAPVQRVAPAPMQRVEPMQQPPQIQRAAPSSAFRPGGGGAAASDRGHSSMRR